MLKLAKAIIVLYPEIQKDLLYGGIILHDLGKIKELSGPITTEYTTAGKLLGHISIIQTDIIEVAKKTPNYRRKSDVTSTYGVGSSW